MLIRLATHADLPGILAIYNDAVLHTTATADYEPGDLESRVAWFESRTRNGFPVFVAVEETSSPARTGEFTSPPAPLLGKERGEVGAGSVVGWSSYGPYHARIGYRFSGEASVYVAADRRGQGVGKLLLPPLIAHARERGMHVLIGSIDSANEASLRLHAAFGFQQVGHLREVFCKFDRWLDVITMELRL